MFPPGEPQDQAVVAQAAQSLLSPRTFAAIRSSAGQKGIPALLSHEHDLTKVSRQVLALAQAQQVSAQPVHVVRQSAFALQQPTLQQAPPQPLSEEIPKTHPYVHVVKNNPKTSLHHCEHKKNDVRKHLL